MSIPSTTPRNAPTSRHAPCCHIPLATLFHSNGTKQFPPDLLLSVRTRARSSVDAGCRRVVFVYPAFVFVAAVPFYTCSPCQCCHTQTLHLQGAPVHQLHRSSCDNSKGALNHKYPRVFGRFSPMLSPQESGRQSQCTAQGGIAKECWEFLIQMECNDICCICTSNSITQWLIYRIQRLLWIQSISLDKLSNTRSCYYDCLCRAYAQGPIFGSFLHFPSIFQTLAN